MVFMGALLHDTSKQVGTDCGELVMCISIMDCPPASSWADSKAGFVHRCFAKDLTVRAAKNRQCICSSRHHKSHDAAAGPKPPQQPDNGVPTL